MILVRPPRIVTVAGNRQRKIRRPRDVRRFAVVQRFQLCQLIGVLFDEVRQPVHQYAAFGSAHLLPPWALVKRRARRRYRLVHVRRVGFRYLRNHFAR